MQKGKDAKTFLEHLEDLRGVLIKSLLAVAVSAAVCFFFIAKIIDFFKRPLFAAIKTSGDMGPAILRSLNPSEVFVISIKAVVVVAIIIASPVIFYQLWRFILPGLTRRESSLAIPVFTWSVFFFFLGVAFSYFVVLKVSLWFFWEYTVRMGIRPEWTFKDYMSFVSVLLLAFGIIFEMPVLSAVLAKLKLINSKTLSEKRLYAILIIFIVAAVITPPDVFSQVLLAVPMIGLYEISILTAKLFQL